MEDGEYFQFDRRSFQVAKTAVAKMTKQSDVLQYLYESRPPFLKEGHSMLGIDKHSLQKQVYGLADKLTINGFPDRGDRLRYLHDVLSKKLVQKDDLFKTVMKFMLEMSQRPTELLRLDLEDAIYSEHAEDDENSSEDERSISDKELLKQILLDAAADAEGITISYSSDSELSDWSNDGKDDESKHATNNDVVSPAKNLKTSHSLSDFSAIQFSHDEERKIEESKLLWSMEVIRAKNFWNSTESLPPRITPLKGQPVITGLLALQAKFGEFWEWKHSVINGNSRSLIPEETVVREILWQFSALDPNCSYIFQSDWNLKPELMVSTLSHSSFASIMLPFQKTFVSLYKMKNFVKQTTAQNCLKFGTIEDENSKFGTPTIVMSYAHGLSEILNHISEQVEAFERQLKISKEQQHFNLGQLESHPCTTLIQTSKNLKGCIELVEMMNDVHSSNFQCSSQLSEYNIEICLKLFSTLSTKLDTQAHQPDKFGILFFLFLKCLHAFLEEIGASISLNWKNHLLFTRCVDVKISDGKFWSKCITKSPHFGKSSYNSSANQCFGNLVTEIVTVLKTSEILRQLDEDPVQIIGCPPDSQKVVAEFIKEVFHTEEEPKTTLEPKNNIQPDYETHFQFLGLSGSLEATSFQYILEKLQQTNKDESCGKQQVEKYKWLLSLDTFPKINPWNALAEVLKKWYKPLITKAKECIYKIFQEYQVEQSLTIFREIILETREDFARAIIAVVNEDKASSLRYKWREPTSINPQFQKILNDCYPDGRANFEIDLLLDNSKDTGYTLEVKPRFPLNLVLLDRIIEEYRFLSSVFARIRKNLWDVEGLSIKDFKTIEGIEPNRLLLFRFSLLHFWSNLREFLVCKMFEKNLTFSSSIMSTDLDQIRRVHKEHFKSIEIRLLRDAVMEKIILNKMGETTQILKQYWKSGLPSVKLVALEDDLKKCWNFIQSFQKASYSKEFIELGCHFGPVPSFLC